MVGVLGNYLMAEKWMLEEGERVERDVMLVWRGLVSGFCGGKLLLFLSTNRYKTCVPRSSSYLTL